MLEKFGWCFIVGAMLILVGALHLLTAFVAITADNSVPELARRPGNNRKSLRWRNHPWTERGWFLLTFGVLIILLGQNADMSWAAD